MLRWSTDCCEESQGLCPHHHCTCHRVLFSVCVVLPLSHEGQFFCILATLPLTFRPFEITLDRNSNICRRQVPAKTLYECRISKLDNPTALRCTEKFLLLTLMQSAPTCSFRSQSLSGTGFQVPQVSPCACQTIHLKH